MIRFRFSLLLVFIIHGLIRVHTVYSAEVAAKCSLFMKDYCFIQQKLELNDGDRLKFIVNSSSSIQTLSIVEGSKLNSIPYGIFTEFTELERLLLEKSGINSLQADRFVGAEKLTFLSLRDNEIRIIPNKVFYSLSNTEEVNLIRNKIENIVDYAFDGMTNLQELKINNNRIRSLSRWTFSGASNIRILHFDNNEIETIEEGALSLPKLRILFLSDNKLKTLPDALFVGAPKLEMMYIERNEITHIGNAFNECNKLLMLSLSNNPIKDLELSKFVTLENLDSLFLDEINFEFPSEIKSHTPTKSKLTTIMLNSNELSDPDIFKYLSIFGRLEEIFAMNNSFTYFNDFDQIKSYFPNLKTLNLARNQPPLCNWITDNKEWITGIEVWSNNGDDSDQCRH